MDVHPRICVSAISTRRLDLAADLAFWAHHGIERVGVGVAKLEAHGWSDGVARVRDAGVDVVNLIGLGPFRLDVPTEWDVQRERMHRTLEAADALGAGSVVWTTGRAGALTWEEAADALESATAPVREDASRRGIHLALEHTHSLRVDVGFVHTLRDAVDLARRLGVSVCMEVNACWSERDLAGTVADAVADLALVQVSDFAVGTLRTPDRVVPGDGDIPLRRILGDVLAAGYGGDFDLELVGPRIEEEGYDLAVGRAIERLDVLLDELGA